MSSIIIPIRAHKCVRHFDKTLRVIKISMHGSGDENRRESAALES